MLKTTRIEPVVPTDFDDLVRIIETCMSENGDRCDLNHIDVSGLSHFNGLFSKKRQSFNGDISKWDVSNANSMALMFRGSAFNGDISKWSVAKVENMAHMFHSSSFNGDLSQWDVSSLVSATSMFHDSAFQGDVSNWDVARVTEMSRMFALTRHEGDFSKWNIGKVLFMDGMFEGCAPKGLSQWNVSGVRSMTEMFINGRCTEDLGNWSIGPGTMVHNMLAYCHYQGACPSFFRHRASTHVLDATYRGSIGATYTLEEAKSLVNDGKWLNVYLASTVSRGLAPLHMAKAMERKTRPAWMSKAAFKWVTEQYPVCLGLGMDKRDSAAWLAREYAQPLHDAGVPETLLFDFSA